MTEWSILAGLVGVPAALAAVPYIARRESTQRPEIPWLLGIAGLLPAWLIAFLGLLGRSSGPRPEKALTLPWILSSSAALLGVIITDAVLRRLRETGGGPRPLTSWLLGAAALLPAWGIALIALSLTGPAR
jgi:hypothetical protein